MNFIGQYGKEKCVQVGVDVPVGGDCDVTFHHHGAAERVPSQLTANWINWWMSSSIGGYLHVGGGCIIALPQTLVQ